MVNGKFPVVPVRYDFKKEIGGFTYTIILKGIWNKKVRIFTISQGY